MISDNVCAKYCKDFRVPLSSVFSLILQLAGCAFVQLFLAHAADLNEYLDDKLRQSKIEFIKIHIQKTSPGNLLINSILIAVFAFQTCSS